MFGFCRAFLLKRRLPNLTSCSTRRQYPRWQSSRFACAMSSRQQTTTTYLDSTQSAEIDKQLMSQKYGYTLPQLMELAGLSVALAVAKQYPDVTKEHVTVLCGPGNNGGDGLVSCLILWTESTTVCQGEWLSSNVSHH